AEDEALRRGPHRRGRRRPRRDALGHAAGGARRHRRRGEPRGGGSPLGAAADGDLGRHGAGRRPRRLRRGRLLSPPAKLKVLTVLSTADAQAVPYELASRIYERGRVEMTVVSFRGRYGAFPATGYAVPL